MNAIFNITTKNLLRRQESADSVKENEFALKIGKDIKWQIVVRRGGETFDVEKEGLQKNDIILKKYWKIESYEITRNGKRMTVKELKEDDKIEQKNYKKDSLDDIIGYRICRGGEDIQINSDDILPTDVVIREFEKERIKTNENNDFILKTDQELIDEYKIKIMEEYKNRIPQKEVIDGNHIQMIQNLQIEIDNISNLDEAKLLYSNVRSL